MPDARVNFVKQQGFADATGATCGIQYPALAFQPRVIGVLVLAGVFLQSPVLFLSLAAVLWWSAFVPALNPFDWTYASLVAARTGRWSVMTARGPRRFAQAMAATFMLVIGLSLIGDGLGMHIPKGYIYFAMGFSVFVEMINLRVRGVTEPVKLHQRYVKDAP